MKPYTVKGTDYASLERAHKQGFITWAEFAELVKQLPKEEVQSVESHE